MYTFLYTFFYCLSFYYTLYLGPNLNLLFMRKTIFFLFAVLIGQFAMADNNIDLMQCGCYVTPLLTLNKNCTWMWIL